MANKYLIKDGLNYYTYNGTSVVDLGTTPPTVDTFINQGFDDVTLALISDTIYSTFRYPELLTYVDNLTALPTATLTMPDTPEGTVATADRTTINVNHYSGINSVTVNGTGGRYLVSFDGGTTWKSRESGAWTIVDTVNIDTLGMTQSTLQALTFTTWGEIFQQTNLDVLIYLVGSDSVMGLSVDLPPNAAPIISNAGVSLSSVHTESFNITANITDPENDMISYQIMINGKDVSDWCSLQPGPINLMFTAGSDLLTVLPGTNTVTINVKDEIGNTATKDLTVVHTDTKPTVSVLQADSNGFKASIGDADNDAVRYRLEFTSLDDGVTVEALPWTVSNTVPISVDFKCDPTSIVTGNNYRYTIYYEDSLGQGGQLTADFVGESTGLLFYNPITSKMLSDSLGNALDTIDLGKFYAGQSSPGKSEVKLLNRTGYALTGLKLSVKELIDEVSVTIDDSVDFANPRTDIDFGGLVLGDDQELSFFVSVDSTANAAVGPGSFDIYAYGQVIQ